ncbi:MAG: TonB-dependent receptor [Gemmatimonadota bacterium]
MLTLRVALTTAILLAISLPLAAQSTATAPRRSPIAGEIFGRVVDSASRAPIGIATVTLSAASPTGAPPLARTTSGADGGFRIQAPRLGTYRIRIVAIGYAPKVIAPLTIAAAMAPVALGTIALVASPIELQSLEVTAPEDAVQLAPDRNTYVVTDMPTTKGGSALDVLKNVPSVDVDIDNTVTLRGDPGVVVQINGRPSPLKGAQLGDFLAQLPADVVEKVEVIPNPSARENPEGVAGIINVVLKEKADPGLSGAVTLSGATTGHIDAGGNLGYQHGALSLYGSYGFFHENRPRTDSLARTNLFLNPITYLDEGADRTQTQQGHTLTGTAGYQLGRSDELSLETLFTTRTEAESNDALFRTLDSGRTLTALNDRLTVGNNDRYNLDATLAEKHHFGDDRHSLSGEVHLLREQEKGPQRVRARDLTLSGSPADTTALEHQSSLDHSDETSLQLDYVRPFSETVQLEAGYKGTFQRFHTALGTDVFDTAQQVFLPDSTRISDFTYDQNVNAAYAILDAEPGKFLLQGGVRLEHAATTFDLVTRKARYDNHYNSAYPSALVAYNFDPAHQIKLSYSTRIRRPDDTDLLDPTPFFLDPLNRTIGNPFLKPEYIRAFELGLQRTAGRSTVQLTPYFRHTQDAVRSIRSIDTAGVVTRTFANVATSDAYGADATVAIRGGRLSGFAGASAFRQVSNAANLGPGLNARTFGWTTRTNLTLKLSRTLDLQSLVSYQGPMTVEQGRIASRTRLSLAARERLMNDRMSLTLRVIDPFNNSRESSFTTDPQFNQVSNRRRMIRGVLLSGTWTFGKPPREHAREPADPGASDSGTP